MQVHVDPVQWPICGHCRLLHSHNLVALGLSVGYETWPPIGWHHPCMIRWSKYRLGFPRVPLHFGLTWPVWISTIFQRSLTVPLHSLNGRQIPAVSAVQGGCERVYGGCEGFLIYTDSALLHYILLSIHQEKLDLKIFFWHCKQVKPVPVLFFTEMASWQVYPSRPNMSRSWSQFLAKWLQAI